MKKIILAAVFLSVTTACLAVNDALWTGFKYSVTVQYLNITDFGVDMPRPRSLQMPDYPIGAMKAAASGVVIVSFVVTETGAVSEIRIEQESVPGFGDSASKAVSQWTFIPGVLLKDRTKAVVTHMRCKMEFSATEGN